MTRSIINLDLSSESMNGSYDENFRKQSELRTYRRRPVTRSSGFHVLEGFTGGECIVKRTESTHILPGKHSFNFVINDFLSPALFKKDLHIVAFGGYLYSEKPITYSVNLKVSPSSFVEIGEVAMSPSEFNDWHSIGIHYEFKSEGDIIIERAEAELIVANELETDLEFIAFDFDAITYEDFIENDYDISFHQKTALSVPVLYYFDTIKSVKDHLEGDYQFVEGQPVIMKDCNRCGRYIPINYNNELNTLGFVLHCKKRAPCKHSTFMSYSVQNAEEIDQVVCEELDIEDGRVISYYGHQLECKACKKFYVNAPLNPKRDAQQHREDSLRRRAIENLVDRLLNRNTVHMEFERKTGKKFTYYIYEKFGHKCFKCGKEISIDEMDLDHTMPLAYLYRMDENATCLCKMCNSQKSDFFPVDFYSKDELERLSKLTGLSLDVLSSRSINEDVLDLLIKNVVWYFDDFLTQRDYAKVRDGILTADKINDSLKRVIRGRVDLAEEYFKITGHYPSSITTYRESDDLL